MKSESKGVHIKRQIRLRNRRGPQVHIDQASSGPWIDKVTNWRILPFKDI